jgi:hypothetical protein
MTEEPTATPKTKLTIEQQSAVLYWPTTATIPIIPCNSKVKGFSSNWKNSVDFSKVDFNAKLANGEYDNGIALVLGKTLQPDHEIYSFALDFDGLDAVLEFFGSWDHVLRLSKETRMEWHGDKGRIHVVFLSNRNNVTNKRIKIKEGAFEVRSNELLIASPSIHGDGNPWSVLGTDQIAVLGQMQMLKLEAKIDALSQGYMSDENKQQYIAWLEDPNTNERNVVARGKTSFMSSIVIACRKIVYDSTIYFED